MMEKFYKFCEYEKSTKRKRKSQENSKRRKLEDSKTKPEELYSESEEEERLNIQASGKRKTSKSPTLKKHKGEIENPAKTANANTNDREYTYDILKGDSSPLDYEPEEQEEANESLDNDTIVDTKSTAGPSRKNSDTEEETELLQNKSVCRRNSSNRCKACKRSKCRKCRECMNPTWKKKCVRMHCLKNKSKTERYRIRHHWVCSVLDQHRFERVERMKREKTEVFLKGEHTDDSFDERDNSSSEDEEIRREKDTLLYTPRARLNKYMTKKRQVEKITELKKYNEYKENVHANNNNFELTQPIYLTGDQASQISSNYMNIEHPSTPTSQVRTCMNLSASFSKNLNITEIIKKNLYLNNT